ncbi:MAG: alpha/beta hydrolase [Planctomycetota bacterium]|nr:alpha/beta hydrolase [Planctomycetota bacterium]
MLPKKLALALVVIGFVFGNGETRVQGQSFPGKPSKWNGFDRFEFPVHGKTATVVAPKKAIEGRPWVWHGEFFGHKPDPDIALLEKGFHVVYLRVPNLLGSSVAVEHWNQLYQTLVNRHRFSKKAALVGLSRGGLYCYNWACANPNAVACIYGDAPVCDFKSWPGGKFLGEHYKGKGSQREWERVLRVYGFNTKQEALAYPKNPVDNLAPLAKQRVPLLHVYGDSDQVVPWEENTGLLASRYRKLGGPIVLIGKKGVGHHPHGLEDSKPIVEFIYKHSMQQFVD